MFHIERRWRILVLTAVVAAILVDRAIAADRTVSVSGRGSVEAPPDEVTIELELKTVDDDLVRVRGTSDQQVRAALELAQKHGAKEGDFEVSSLRLGLSYNQQLKRQIYHVDRKMSTKLGTLENLNPLLADLLKQPDLKVERISFGSRRAAEHEAEARRRAMSDARSKAAQAAELADLKLGKPVAIRLGGESQLPFVTSVSPVAEQIDDPFGGLPQLDRDPKVPAATSGRQVAARQLDGQFVALALGGADEDEKADGASFGLGGIRFSASVFVDYELME